MAKPDSTTLVVGISSTGLFDLSEAGKVFEEGGIKKYREHMLANEDVPLEPGTGMPLVRALLGLRRADGQEKPPLVEVVVMSQNSPETGIRIANTVRQMGLPISRFAFTGGEPLADFIEGYYIDLFLSTNDEDVQRVIDTGKCAAARLYAPPAGYEPVEKQVRIAFDADAVLFSDESEIVNKNEGLAAFHDRENKATEVPLPDGPFATFLRKLGAVKQATDTDEEYAPVRLAVVTARNAPAEKRVVLTLRHWGVYVDAAFFLGGWEKMPVLRAFRPHVFFDDQERHVLPAAQVVPSARVPYHSKSPLATPAPCPNVQDGIVPMRRSQADAILSLGGEDIDEKG